MAQISPSNPICFDSQTVSDSTAQLVQRSDFSEQGRLTLFKKFKNPSIEERILDNLDFGINLGAAEDVKVTVSIGGQ